MWQEVDRLTLTIVTDNYYDALRPDPPVGVRYRARPGASVHGEHGFSCHLETVTNGGSRILMFDYGLDSALVTHNMALLGIDPGAVDAFVLSHGHFDHFGGLLDLLGRARPGAPLYVGEEAFARRYSRRPGVEDLVDLGRLEKERIEGQGVATIVETKEPVEGLPGCFLTGKIPRNTAYETGSPHLFVDREGLLERDHFPGEQGIVWNVKGKGLVVLSGCSHSGIVNTVSHAMRITGTNKVHAVIGGFHLVNAEPETIRRTVTEIKAIGPDYVIPTHCTGFEALRLFASEMAEEFILNTLGTRYVFAS
jgi:7,8-dihydropterin-6-yl-methyl-4-(beta-D-ribofuranosyl)aminobenzene 5'-phosphate synthase